MYNYHTDIVWAIDKVLFLAAALLAAATIAFLVIKEYLRKRRNEALLNIKRNVYDLTLSGHGPSDKVCVPLSADITIQQFLDIATNRNREAIFFNDSEQKIFKSCFVSPEKTAEIEKIAEGSHNKWRRIEAILSLGYAGVGSALPVLQRSLNSKDEDVCYFSVIAMGQIKNPASAGMLLDFLKKRKIFSYKIISVLESFPVGIADEVIGSTDDPDPSIRLWGTRLLSKIKAAKYIKKIESLAGDESEEVRSAACECLGELGKREAESVIKRCLKDESWLVRAHAVKALSRLLGKDCLPEIVGRINDPSLSVIESVKDVMVEHIEAAMPYIEKFLSGDDEVAKRTALEAVELSGRLVKSKKKSA